MKLGVNESINESKIPTRNQRIKQIRNCVIEVDIKTRLEEESNQASKNFCLYITNLLLTLRMSLLYIE